MRVPVHLSFSGIVRSLGAMCILGATWVFAANLGSAQVTSGIDESPNPVQTEAQFNASTGGYQGDAGVITVTIAANSTLEVGVPIKFEECNLDPTSQANC